jgi:hypothetical protein
VFSLLFPIAKIIRSGPPENLQNNYNTKPRESLTSSAELITAPHKKISGDPEIIFILAGERGGKAFVM